MDQYLELREAALAGSTITGGGNPVTGPTGGSSAPAVAGPSEAEKRDARKAKNRIDRQLGKLAAAGREDPRPNDRRSRRPRSFDDLAELNKKLKDLAEEREGLELEWLEALEVLGE